MSKLYVGFDISQKSVSVCALLEDGSEPIKRFCFDHNLLGFNKFTEKINSVAEDLGITELLIAMESTGMLWWHLCEAIRNCEPLERLVPKAYVINAKLVANFKKAYVESSKTDPGDAFVIADRLRFGRLPKPAEPDEKYLAIQKLTRHRFHLVNTLAKEKNRFLSNLFLKFSGFCQEKPLSDTFGATSCALLTEFLSVDEIANTSLEDLALFISKKSKNAFAAPEEVAKVVKQAARNSYRLNKHLTDPVNMVLAMILENIRFFQNQIALVDKAITKELAAFSHAQVLLSLRGIGQVFTAGIIAEVGDINRFDTDASLARFASIVWKNNQSGEFSADDTPMMRSGNKYLRYYLIEAANSLRMHNEEYAAYYNKKYSEASTHRHKRACALTARKLVRLIHTLLRNGQLYRTPDQRKEALAADPTANTISPGELARHAIRHRQAARRR